MGDTFDFIDTKCSIGVTCPSHDSMSVMSIDWTNFIWGF